MLKINVYSDDCDIRQIIDFIYSNYRFIFNMLSDISKSEYSCFKRLHDFIEKYVLNISHINHRYRCFFPKTVLDKILLEKNQLFVYLNCAKDINKISANISFIFLDQDKRVKLIIVDVYNKKFLVVNTMMRIYKFDNHVYSKFSHYDVFSKHMMPLFYIMQSNFCNSYDLKFYENSDLDLSHSWFYSLLNKLDYGDARSIRNLFLL